MPTHQLEVVRRLKQIRIKFKDEDEEDNYLYPISHNICEGFLMLLLNLLFFILLPIYLMAAFITVEPNEAVVLSSFGKIRSVIKEPGCHYNPLLNIEKISTKVETL